MSTESAKNTIYNALSELSKPARASDVSSIAADEVAYGARRLYRTARELRRLYDSSIALKAGPFWVKGGPEDYERSRRAHRAQVKDTPAPTLVGVETNPGPPRRSVVRPLPATRQAASAEKRMVQSMVKNRNAATNFGATQRGSAPRYSPLKNGGTRIKHREFITDINSQGTPFAVYRYAVNPGNVELFPWLSTVASAYESYRFRSLKFHYNTDTPNTTAGSIIQAFDPDPSDATPTSKQQLLTFQSSVTSSVSVPSTLNVDAAVLTRLKMFFVRNPINVPPPNTAQENFDVGAWFPAHSNVPVNTILGEFSVEYDIELITPGQQAHDAVSQTVYGGPGVDNNGATWGSNRVLTGDKIMFPTTAYSAYFQRPGTYLMTCYVQGTGLTGNSPTAGGTASSRVINLGGGPNSAGTSYTFSFLVKAAETFETLGITINAVTTIASVLWRISSFSHDLTLDKARGLDSPDLQRFIPDPREEKQQQQQQEVPQAVTLGGMTYLKAHN